MQYLYTVICIFGLFSFFCQFVYDYWTKCFLGFYKSICQQFDRIWKVIIGFLPIMMRFQCFTNSICCHNLYCAKYLFFKKNITLWWSILFLSSLMELTIFFSKNKFLGKKDNNIQPFVLIEIKLYFVVIFTDLFAYDIRKYIY